MVQQNKPLAIPKTVQKWIRRNVPALVSGTKLGFSKPQHDSVNYAHDSWHVTLHVRSLAQSIYFHPGRYPKSVRDFVSHLPKNINVYLVIRRGHVGTEMENWRGFALKKGRISQPWKTKT
jgi:hypothetical protein